MVALGGQAQGGDPKRDKPRLGKPALPLPVPEQAPTLAHPEPPLLCSNPCQTSELGLNITPTLLSPGSPGDAFIALRVPAESYWIEAADPLKIKIGADSLASDPQRAVVRL